MGPKTSPALPSRQLVARCMKAGFVLCWILMAGGVVALVVANHLSPAALAAVIAAIACLAGVFVVLFQSMGKWARDPGYSLAGKGLALLFALVAANIMLIFLSSAL